MHFVARSPLVIGLFEVARRVTAFAVSKPCKEALYTVVSREKKYAAKTVIDTFVYRFGGMIGALSYSYLAEYRIDNVPTSVEKVLQFLIITCWFIASARLTSLRTLKLKLE